VAEDLGEGVIGCDLDQPDLRLPFDDDTFDMAEASHLIEHLIHLFPFMDEVHRVLKPSAPFYIAVPFGSSDAADEDPTHVRKFFPGSWAYFSQPTFWRTPPYLKADFKPAACILYVDELRYPAGDAQQLEVIQDIVTKRNTVHEMRAVLEAVKPARTWNKQEDMDKWETRVVFADLTGASPKEARASRISGADHIPQGSAEEADRQALWTPS
jgi:SAM-dependent methyltransferase